MTKDQIEKTFIYHQPKNDQAARYEKIRAAAKEFALLLAELCPESRELSVAHTHLQTVVMFANASIAIGE